MKRIFTWGLMLAATLTLTNCAKEMPQGPVEETAGIPFEIVASTVDTKTANDGMSTKWVAEDQINLFHAVCDGTTYTDDGAFTVANIETGNFTGTISEELDPQEEYDWYAFYPYSSFIKTPANTDSGYMPVGCKSGASQTQNGNNSMAHIAGENYPLVGKAYAVPAAGTPAIQMSHVSSLLEVVVTNDTEEPLTVSEIIVNAPEALVGTFYINFSGEITPDSFTGSGTNYVSTTAKLIVNNGTAIAKGESAKFYLAVKPFTVAASEAMQIHVNGYEKELVMTNEVTFSAGKIKTINFAYNKAEEEPIEALALPWFEDFSSMDLSKYIITSGGSDTKIYETDKLAGGTAPEILISKDGGSFTANLSTGGYVGDLTLSFKSNYPTRITVSVTSGVTMTKVSDTEYTLHVPEGVESFSVTLKNTVSSNVRVDDIEVAQPRKAQTLSFGTAEFNFEKGSAEASAFIGQEVVGAQTNVTYSSSNSDVATVDPSTGKVTLGEGAGLALITATAEQTSEYKGASASYQITITDPNAAEPVTESLNIYANKGSLANKVITWEGDAFIVSNAQASSTNAIRTSDSDHYRAYANSELTFTAKNNKTFNKIVITCTSGSYATVIQNSATGYTATVSGSVVTLTPAAGVSEVSFKMSAQARFKKVEATLQ